MSVKKNNLTQQKAATLIDISAVQTSHYYADIASLVEYAKEYHFINVHVLPNWVSVLSEMLKNVPGVRVGAPVGFPSGGHTTRTKLAEASQLIDDGVEEMDIVMNIGRLKNREYDYVEDELRQIIEMAHLAKKDILTKVIIEINVLSDEEMLKASDIVIASGADFVKTGTGWIPGNANIERIRKIKNHCTDRIKVKAAGGIRTRAEFDELVLMGVERMGINASSALEIICSFNEKKQNGNGGSLR